MLRYRVAVVMLCPVLAGPTVGRAEGFFQVDVFSSGLGGYNTFRIPAIASTTEGVLLAFAEGRKNSTSDSGDIDLVLRRSADHGLTWGPLQLVWDNGAGVAGNPVPVVDETTGNILLVTNHQPAGTTQTSIRAGTPGHVRTYHVQRSSDQGLTWGTPARIDATDVLDPRWLAGGPNHGIQLVRGERAGRLVVAGNHSLGSGFDTNQAHAIYSGDGGATWQLGAVGGESAEIYPSETAAVELADGRLYFTIRDHYGPSLGNRAYGTSSDAGESFDGPFVIDSTIISPIVQGSILRYSSTDQGDSENRILQSFPHSSSAREQILVRSSFDEAATWNHGRVVYEGSSAYSDLVRTGDDRIGLLYERDNYSKISFASFTTQWLDATEPTQPPVVLTGQMLGFWKLDEGTGQIASDHSGMARHGRLGDSAGGDVNDPVWTADPERGTVLSFQGTSYVDLSEQVAGFQDVSSGTISLWLKTTSPADQAVLAASDASDGSSEVRIILEDQHTVWFDVRDDSSSPPGEDGHIESYTPLNDGQWHQVVVAVGAENDARLSVDGQLEDVGSEPFFVVQSLNRMALGRNVDSSGPQWHYQGRLSDVAIFSEPLSDAMVLAAYQLDQADALDYDISQAIELFKLELGESIELEGRRWFALGGLSTPLGQIVESGGQYFVRLSDAGTGVGTVGGLLPGDANFDGVVDDLDVAILAAHWQQSDAATWLHCDFTGDGAVDDLDASILAAHWLAGLDSSSSVPEPSGFVPLAIATALGALAACHHCGFRAMVAWLR